ncbi:hypothetical protein QQF64_018543 [Cirrhinus molitorella]|uniref:Uncharacterized protein n=1 Tax=Cirrhinus molitorella TaxID=172907 RepID=A0ABR3LCY4_9TELE
MVNYCVCGGCTNSSLSGHRVNRFPCKKRDGAIFRAWVRFVQVKRRNFTTEKCGGSDLVPVHRCTQQLLRAHLHQLLVRASARNMTVMEPSEILLDENVNCGPLLLAAQYFNHNGSREVAQTSDGEVCYAVRYPSICISPHGVPEIGKLQITAGFMRTKHCLVFRYTCSPFQIPPKNQQG